MTVFSLALTYSANLTTANGKGKKFSQYTFARTKKVALHPLPPVTAMFAVCAAVPRHVFRNSRQRESGEDLYLRFRFLSLL